MDDLFVLAKDEHGVTTQLPAPAAPNRIVQISAIKNLQYVNALAEGQPLPIVPSGLKIIYGENGTEKSGYSRVLKQAYRARDRPEPLLGGM